MSNGELWSYFINGISCLVVTFDTEKKPLAVQFVIADPDTGFSKWRQPLSRNVHYRATHKKKFHTFHFKDQYYLLAGLQFLNEPTANIFLALVLHNLPKFNLPNEIVEKIWKKSTIKKFSKGDISSPYMFHDVVGADDPFHNQQTEEEDPRDTITRGKSTVLGQDPIKRPSWPTNLKPKTPQKHTFS